MGFSYSTHDEKRNACRVFVRWSEGKTSLRRPRCEWESINKMDFRETALGDMDYIYFVQTILNTIINLRVP
jgi:hypothetical protein